MLAKLFQEVRQSARPETVEIGGRTYTTNELHPALGPAPAALIVSNLSSLVRYMHEIADRDAEKESLIVHVRSPREAAVLSLIFGDFYQRREYLRATEGFSLTAQGPWMSPEQFIVTLQLQFVPDDTTKLLLAIVGNIDDAIVRKTVDDGVTQTVTVRAGITRVGNVDVPPRVTLRPYRSFVETEQAESAFILRMQSGKGEGPPQIALFEADGGAWRNKAMATIREYLVRELPAGVVVLA
jgi:hypothetical protein